MSAREVILGRIREALSDVVQPDPALDVPIPWEYGRPTGMPDILERFVEMVDDYKAAGAAGAGAREADPPLTHQELNAIEGVLTASVVSIAETGTIVLDHGPDQGRRALSLVPDLHLCVVRADQVVSDVPEAVGRLAASIGQGRPLTWISGGSATSDIELNRVEGVHGPRTLLVVLAE